MGQFVSIGKLFWINQEKYSNEYMHTVRSYSFSSEFSSQEAYNQM